jgi:hypothetical protein
MSVTFADVGGGDLHLYRNTTNLPSGNPLTGTWQPDGRRANPFNVIDTSVRDTQLAGFANMSASGEWTLFVADLHAGGSNLLSGWELEFTGPETPPVTWSSPADIVYGTALGSAQLAATSPVVGTFSYFPPAGTVLNAGTGQQLAAVFTPANGSAYLSTTNYSTITVLPKNLTITADNKTKVYSAALPELTLHYSGFIKQFSGIAHPAYCCECLESCRRLLDHTQWRIKSELRHCLRFGQSDDNPRKHHRLAYGFRESGDTRFAPGPCLLLDSGSARRRNAHRDGVLQDQRHQRRTGKSQRRMRPVRCVQSRVRLIRGFRRIPG